MGRGTELPLTMPTTIDRTEFREAMSRVAASVHIVTTDGPAGRRGTTVTSVCSVADTPATLLVCLNQSSPDNARFEANGVFAVHLLGARSEAVARAFAGEGKLDTQARFATARFAPLATGAPVMAEALAAFDCRLVGSTLVATHRILIGEVVAIRLGEPDDNLLYRGRAYRRF